MCKNIEYIIGLLNIILNLQEKRRRILSNEYICKNYESYKDDKIRIDSKIEVYKRKVEVECNNYLNYPESKLWVFDFTKKVEFKEDNIWGTILKVPFIDNKEYFCLINLFENHKEILYQLYYNEYILRRSI